MQLPLLFHTWTLQVRREVKNSEDITQIMLASSQVGELVVRFNETQVLPETPSHAEPPGIRLLIFAATQQLQKETNANGTEGSLHRHRPVHADPYWVPVDPIGKQILRRLTVTGLATNQPRLGQNRQKLQARQFPRHFHV